MGACCATCCGRRTKSSLDEERRPLLNHELTAVSSVATVLLRLRARMLSCSFCHWESTITRTRPSLDWISHDMIVQSQPAFSRVEPQTSHIS